MPIPGRLPATLRQLDIFQRQVELVGRQLLGFRAELLALKDSDDALHPALRLLRIRQRRLDLDKARFQQGIFSGKKAGIHAIM